jgi:hypothetical protein
MTEEGASIIEDGHAHLRETADNEGLTPEITREADERTKKRPSKCLKGFLIKDLKILSRGLSGSLRAKLKKAPCYPRLPVVFTYLHSN